MKDQYNMKEGMKFKDFQLKDLWKSKGIPMRGRLFKYLRLNLKFPSTLAKRYKDAVNLHFVIQ